MAGTPALSLVPNYVTVAASQTAATLSTALGAYLVRLIIQPATTAPGTVILYDGKGATPTTVFTFPSGTTQTAELKPIVIELGVRNLVPAASLGAGAAEGWYITTGANVSVVAVVQKK